MQNCPQIDADSEDGGDEEVKGLWDRVSHSEHHHFPDPTFMNLQSAVISANLWTHSWSSKSAEERNYPQICAD